MRQKNRRLRHCAGGESKFNPPGGLSVHVPTLRRPRRACPERSRRGGATSIGTCLLVGQPAEGWVFRTNPLSAAALSNPPTLSQRTRKDGAPAPGSATLLT